jgi:hemolysin activation/secretion protein
MMISKVGILASALLASAAWATAGATLAQPAPPPPSTIAPSRQELDPADRRAAAPPARNSDLFAPPSSLPCPLATSILTFRLQGVDVVGATIARRDAERAYADLIGKDIPVSKICEIRDRLSSILFAHGRLARVEVPEQTISAGRLKLEVTEARIVAVRVHGDVGSGQDKVEGYLEKLRGLTPFDLDTAQRYLLLANDVPGMRISAALRPSAEGRGAIDLEVTLERVPMDYVAAIQNTGSKELGPWSGLARVDLNSFTPLGERTTLIGYHTLTDNEQWIVQLVEEARYGADGLVGRMSLAYGQSRPGGVLAPLKLEGKSFVGAAELQYPLIKLRRHSLVLAGGLDVVDQTTSFPGGGVLADDKIRVLWTHLAGEYIKDLGHGFTSTGNGELELRKGLSALGASKTGDPNLSRIQGLPDAWVARFEGDVHLTYRWVDFELRSQAQYANKPLLSYEEQALGDLTIGRGYEPAVVSGDRAAAAEIKASVIPIRVWRATFSPFVFYDQGYVENLDIGSVSRTLRSYGAGVEGRFPYGIQASLAWADPLDKPFPTNPTKPSPKVLFQLVLRH